MASQDDEEYVLAGRTKTTSSSIQPPELEMPPRSSICSQLGEAIWNPQSPLTPSPEGSAEITSILQRLESIELESRELLTQLFSMVQTDARLERYIRRRLQDHRLSKMWELVEQILATQQTAGSLDVDSILQQSDDNSGSYSSWMSEADQDKEVKKSAGDDEVDGADGGVRNERFRVKEFDQDKDGGDGQPLPPVNPPSVASSSHLQR